MIMKNLAHGLSINFRAVDVYSAMELVQRFWSCTLEPSRMQKHGVPNVAPSRRAQNEDCLYGLLLCVGTWKTAILPMVLKVMTPLRDETTGY
jgi:hypothetical protein